MSHIFSNNNCINDFETAHGENDDVKRKEVLKTRTDCSSNKIFYLILIMYASSLILHLSHGLSFRSISEEHQI